MNEQIFSKESIKARQDKASQALEKLGKNVLVFSGEPVGKPGGLDQTYPFIPHPRHYWLSGLRRSGCAMAYAPGEGWTSFVRPVDYDEIIWEGGRNSPEGRPMAELPAWLEKHSDTVLACENTPYGNYPFSPEAAEIIDSCRRPKDSEEIMLIRKAAEAAAAGFAKIREILQKPGAHLSEKAIQTELEAEFMRHGAHGTSFDTIVAADRNAAVLHFPPGGSYPSKTVMIDAGTQINGYCCDVTRTIPVNGKYSARYKEIFDLVIKAQSAAINAAAPGAEWNKVHLAAAKTITDGLISLGILKGSSDELMANGTTGLFLPHGIGHMLGLGVRDVGGKLKGRENNRYAGAGIRVDMPLEEGFIMTAEPGIYFIEPLLKAPETKAKYGSFINWPELEKWLETGGCRQEDDILITKTGCEVLTKSIPKEK